jgi:hypothetical protein
VDPHGVTEASVWMPGVLAPYFDWEVERFVHVRACSHFSDQASSSAQCEVAICFNRFHRPAL